MKSSRRFFLISILLGVAVVFLGWFAFTRLRPYKFHGSLVPSAGTAPDFTLQGVNGPVSLGDFRGKIVLLYFGYTFCPDVCPTTMTDLAKAMQLLGKQADHYQVIMITVDPERDTPEKTDAYVKHFDPNFIGLSGTPEEIAQVATLYGIFYEREEGSAATGYLINHTASTTVLDKDGRLKLIFPFGTAPEDIASDLQHLR